MPLTNPALERSLSQSSFIGAALFHWRGARQKVCQGSRFGGLAFTSDLLCAFDAISEIQGREVAPLVKHRDDGPIRFKDVEHDMS